MGKIRINEDMSSYILGKYFDGILVEKGIERW